MGNRTGNRLDREPESRFLAMVEMMEGGLAKAVMVRLFWHRQTKRTETAMSSLKHSNQIFALPVSFF